MKPTALILTACLAVALSGGAALAQAARINLEQEKGELNAMGLTLTEGEDAGGNSTLTYDLDSSQPETLVTFRDCNAAGCTTAVFQQRLEGVCISRRCHEFRQGRGMTEARRLADADVAALAGAHPSSAIRLRDGEHVQEIFIERTWTASDEERLSSAVMENDYAMYQLRQGVQTLLRPGA